MGSYNSCSDDYLLFFLGYSLSYSSSSESSFSDFGVYFYFELPPFPLPILRLTSAEHGTPASISVSIIYGNLYLLA